MLDTALQPYTDIADLFIVDPDGYVIRSVLAGGTKVAIIMYGESERSNAFWFLMYFLFSISI